MENSLLTQINNSTLPVRHSSMYSLGRGNLLNSSNQNLNQFYFKQMEILKLQQALKGYQARGKIPPFDIQKSQTIQLHRNKQNVKLPQINQKHTTSLKEINNKVLQPVKISAQIKYNLSKEMQDLWSNNLNGNYYYLQDKNNQWESRKQKWIFELDNCLQSNFLDYQEMYEKFFKGKNVKKNYQFKKKSHKQLQQHDKTKEHAQQDDQNNQNNQDLSQKEILSVNTSTVQKEEDEDQGKSNQLEILTSDRNILKESNMQGEQSNQQSHPQSINTSMQGSKRQEQLEGDSINQNDSVQIINEEVPGDEQVYLGGITSSQNQTHNAIESNTEMQNVTNSMEAYQIRPINQDQNHSSSQQGLHKKNKTLPVSQNNKMKISVISPKMELSNLQNNNNSFHSINQTNQNSSVFSTSKNHYENQLLMSPQNSNRNSKQEFYPLGRQPNINSMHAFQNQSIQRLRIDKNFSDGHQNIQQPKFSLAQLKTKNFSKIQQSSSQKSEDFVFRVSQIENLKKYH